MPNTLNLSQVATRIVIGNLIRNAFQHTWEGKVVIQQTGNNIAIDNDCLRESDLASSGDQGFGLDLQLPRQLCEKLGWAYTTI